jgi:hypothetical protein
MRKQRRMTGMRRIAIIPKTKQRTMVRMIRCRDYTTYFFRKGMNGLKPGNGNILLMDYQLKEMSDGMIVQGPEVNRNTLSGPTP